MLLSLRTLFTPAAVVLLATGAALDEFGFHAEEGSRVVRTFEFEFEMELESMSMTVGGNDVPTDHIAGMEMSVGQSSHIVVTDEYGPAEGGRPLSLTRTYDELIGASSSSSSGPAGESDNDLDQSSALEGNTVVFTWDADAEEYDVEFAEDGDEELLAGLEEDMDLRGFLPDDEVAEGESWETDIEPFRRVIQAVATCTSSRTRTSSPSSRSSYARTSTGTCA